MAQGVVYQDAQGAIIAANPAAERILGLSLDQMQGGTSSDPRWCAVHEDGSPFLGETQPAMVALHTVQPVHNVVMGLYVAAEDRHRWVNVNAVPQFKAGETVPNQVYTTFEDITERKKIEQQLKESEARFHALFENVPMQGVIYRLIRDEQDEIVDWEISDINPLGAASIGGQGHELLGKRALALFGPDVMAAYLPTSRQVAASNQPQFFETHFATNERDYLSSVFMVGETHYANISVDITERKQAEALLYAQCDLARCIGTAGTVEWGFRGILEVMLRLTGMDSGGMYLFSSDAQSLDLVYHQGLGAEFIQAVARFPIDSPNAQLILTGKPFYFRHDHPVRQSPRYLAEGLRSAAAIPILYQDRVIGCFNLASHTEDDVRHFARQALEPLSLEIGNFVVHLQAQAAVRASEEKFRQIADTINEVFWIFDNGQQRLVYLNPAYEKVWGIAIADTYHDSRKYIEAIHPDDRPILFAALARQAQGEQTEMEYRIVRPDGAVRWILDRSFPILGGDGQVQRTTGVATDITALKHSRQELQELNRSLEERVAERTAEVQDLYDNAPAGYHSLDANGRLLRINQTELNWLGYTREELIGRSYMEVITEASRTVFRSNLPIFKQRGFVRDLEFDLVRKDGTTFPVLVNGTAVYDEQGSYVASRSTVFDNTERKRAELVLRASEETLRYANAELARALRLKDEFLAGMSHELRTPLHGILAMTETLLDQIRGPLNEHQQRSVRLIEQSGRHLLALINDLLDLSKIEAGKLDLHLGAVSVDDVCQSSLLFVRELAVKKEIAVDYANAMPGIRITADEQRLKQMLVNLLGNAVKFTPSGGHVRLDVTVDPGCPSDPDGGRIHFAVQDDGPGIAPADQARLFQPFIQIDAQLSRQHEGTGLGLALVKRLAEQHGGRVRLDSSGVPGEGCCFTITLPIDCSSIHTYLA